VDEHVGRLGNSKYVLVTTFRKDGTSVPTPLWVARAGDELLVWTVADSGKVKRIRRNSSVEVAECDVRGTPSGESIKTTARVLGPAETQRVRQLIAKKYGILGRLVLFGSRLRRGREGTIGIAISLPRQPAASTQG
jgi:uncharacterized protein